jgi:hypothetical protein
MRKWKRNPSKRAFTSLGRTSTMLFKIRCMARE